MKLNNTIKKGGGNRLWWYSICFVSIWTLICSTSLVWNFRKENLQILELSRAEARGVYNKDLVYRRWAAGRGGVYVPVTKETPPNPYLSHIEDRDITLSSGEKLTLVNPAYMTRQVHEIGAKQYGLQGHITSLDPIRPENTPDPWETKALKALAKGEIEMSSIEKIKNVTYMRLMLPMITEESCLKCHASQGYKVGDIRGGVSVSVPMKSYQDIAMINKIPLVLGHSFIWILGAVGIAIGYLNINRRITEGKKLESQYRQAQKMEAIGKLAGGVAHDFNNALTPIIGITDMELFEMKQDHPLYESLMEINIAGKRCADLTRQLLAFARCQPLEMISLNLNDVVDNLEKMLSRIIGEDIELVKFLEPQLNSVKADVGQIEQIIMNLAVNARDAMPDGGKLTIETRNVILDDSYSKTHVSIESGNYVMLALSDNGVGMDEKTRSMAFDPFFTTKEKGKGTGLGLSTVYGIVKQSGGYIWIYSEPGIGTTFKIYLPFIEEEPEMLSVSVEADIDSMRGLDSILLVEDDDSVRTVTKLMLARNGYQVHEAKNGEEAIKMSKTLEGKIDLMITDVVMPGMSGKNLADTLSNLFPALKVLFISGYTDDAIVHHGVLAEGTHFIQKPFAAEVLYRKVREVLDKE